MDTHRPDDPAPLRLDIVSRREVLLRVGAGGLAVALLANGIEAAQAQDATPPMGGELPPGVGATPLFAVPVTDMPTGPFTIQVTRVTVEPGSATPLSAAPFPQLGYVEAGEGLICPPANQNRWVYGPDGTLLDSGAGEFPFPLGSVCYWSPNTTDGVRNDGTDQASILRINLVPTTEGTPTP